MRALLPCASLLLAAGSLLVSLYPPAPGSRLCRYGGCRFDQIYAGIDAAGITLESLGVMLAADPANPLVWCTYAEMLSTRGETAPAQAAFDHAVALGGGMSPVLMRAANFDFTHSREEHGGLLAKQILTQTGVFDQILFSYLLDDSLTVAPLLGTAIPATPRAAQAWLAWLGTGGSDADLLATWSWMRQQRLYSPESAVGLAWTLWQRRSYQTAQTLWADWLGAARGDYLRPQRLANRHFENAPNTSPFDWALTPPASVEIARQDGLQIHFSGTANVDFSGVRQFTTAAPGRYRFAAEVQTSGLSTDQRPFFHIFDAAHANLLSVTTEPLGATLPRSWVSVTFTVPAKTETVAVQLERRPSQRFDNNIAGTLHIYQVSLLPN